MNLPFALPDIFPSWVPSWVQLILLALALLYGLALLAMPFNVFGVKGRLEGLEARMDEMQADLRRLANRPVPTVYGGDYDQEPVLRAPVVDTPRPRPPIPAAPRYPEQEKNEPRFRRR